MRVALNTWHRLLRENNRQKEVDRSPQTTLCFPHAAGHWARRPRGDGQGRGVTVEEAGDGGGGEAGAPGSGGGGQPVGRRSGARRLAGSPHLLRRALLQDVLLHGHGPRGGGGARLLAPPPALAAALRRAPGSGADRREGQRPRQPGAKAMAAGVRGHRRQAAKRRLRGPRRPPHVSTRPASAPLVRGGPGHEPAEDAGARESAGQSGGVTRSRAPPLAARGSRAALGKGERGRRERPPGMALSSSLRESSSLPSPTRRPRPRPAAPPPQSPARRPP